MGQFADRVPQRFVGDAFGAVAAMHVGQMNAGNGGCCRGGKGFDAIAQNQARNRAVFRQRIRESGNASREGDGVSEAAGIDSPRCIGISAAILKSLRTSSSVN